MAKGNSSGRASVGRAAARTSRRAATVERSSRQSRSGATPQGPRAAGATTAASGTTGLSRNTLTGESHVDTPQSQAAARANAGSGPQGEAKRQAPLPSQRKSPEQLEKERKGTPRQEQPFPQVGVTGQLDHAAVNHTREAEAKGAGPQELRSDAGPGRTEARGSTPWPADITKMSPVEAAEAIRNTDKADILTKWHKDERNSATPRQDVMDLLFEKRLRVQGPPLPPID